MKIKNIKRVQKQKTYDLSIQDNHNYFVGNSEILIHNSSKDYTKVDRSGLYAARWIAKNLVAKGYAKKCSVQLSYAIGIAKPLSVNVDTQGTYTSLNDDELSELVSKFPLTVNWIKDKFFLDNISKISYADIAARGQVGEDDYPWEQLELDLF